MPLFNFDNITYNFAEEQERLCFVSDESDKAFLWGKVGALLREIEDLNEEVYQLREEVANKETILEKVRKAVEY